MFKKHFLGFYAYPENGKKDVFTAVPGIFYGVCGATCGQHTFCRFNHCPFIRVTKTIPEKFSEKINFTEFFWRICIFFNFSRVCIYISFSFLEHSRKIHKNIRKFPKTRKFEIFILIIYKKNRIFRNKNY